MGNTFRSLLEKLKEKMMPPFLVVKFLEKYELGILYYYVEYECLVRDRLDMAHAEIDHTNYFETEAI